VEESPPQEKQNNNRRWWLISAVLLVVIVSGALIVFLRLAPKPAATAGDAPAAAPTDPAPLAAAPSIGPEGAPVTIIEYADFGCPSCQYWYTLGVLDQLRTRYGDQMRFIWRDYPVITLDSPKAAEAGQCAHEQGKFWEFHDAIYEHDGQIGAADLEKYAAAIGLDMSQFDECVTTRRYRERVNAEMSEAFKHGYNGAPYFAINDRIVVGPQPLKVFAGLIDPMLSTK
jgi:protein-disulfide isomerase